METQLQKLLFLVFITLISVEVIWVIVTNKKSYNVKDSFANFAIILIGRLLKPISVIWALFLFSVVEGFQLWQMPVNVLTFIITFFIVEFVYYWYHRLSHEIPFLWSIHHTHHSSLWFNLTAAGRLNWIGKFTSVLFYLPLILIGFNATLVVLSLSVSLFYQFLLHTEFIDKIPFLEGRFLNTPSAHRVHHGSNEKYLDKNYGGMLIIFDRIFNTYIPETELVRYGVTTGFISHNPFVIVFKPVVEYVKKAVMNK